jgi:hypothetical protein
MMYLSLLRTIDERFTLEVKKFNLMFEEITECFLNSIAVRETALAENVRNDWQIFCT